MQHFEIKITGSGTKNQLEIALLQVVRDLQFSEPEELKITEREDPILMTEISEA